MKYLILIIFIFVIFYFINNNLIENFKNYVNPFYKNKSFCSFNKDKKKCECIYQKDSIGIGYSSPETACNNNCFGKNNSECNSKINNELFYYCKEGDKCIKYKGSNQNKYISTNNCGFDTLTNLIKLPYIDKETCEKSINTCNSYNNKTSNAQIKEKCLKNTECGFCTNQFGTGKCVEGTAEGPLDLNLNCSPNNFKNNNNKYEYGNFQFI